MSSRRVCQNCKGTKFEEKNEFLFCVRCNTQDKDYVPLETNVEDLMASQRKKKVAVQKEKLRKAMETVLWSSYEAYNLILLEQCRFLIEEVDAPEALRDVLLAIWAAFLEKFEVAFVPNSPKLPVSARLRDIVYFNDDLTTMPYFPQQRRLNLLKEDVKKDSHSKILIGKLLLESSPRPRSQNPKKHCLRNDILKSFPTAEFVDEDSGSDSDPHPSIDDDHQNFSTDEENSNDVEDSENFGFSENISEEPSSTKRKKPRRKTRQESEEEKKKEAQERRDFIQELRNLPKSRLNSYSKQFQASYKKLRNTKQISNLYAADNMSLQTTVSMVYLATRYMNLDIHLKDLMIWIIQGVFPYFTGFRYLPEEWELNADDLKDLVPRVPPQPLATLRRASDIAIMLEIPRKALSVDIFELIDHFIQELNLPKNLLSVFERTNQHEAIQMLGNVVDLDDPKYSRRCRNMFPNFEANALAVIIVALKKLFTLKEKTTDKICQKIRGLPESHKYFIFDEWREYSFIRLHLIKSMIFPLFDQNFKQVGDSKTIVDFFNERALSWKKDEIFHFNNHKLEYDTQKFREELVSIVEKTLQPSNNETNLWMRRPSKCWISDATNHCASMCSEDMKKYLSTSFKEKSLGFLDAGLCFDYESLHPSSLSGKKKQRMKIYSEQSFDIQMLVEYCSLILHQDKEIFLQFVIKMERSLFPSHILPRWKDKKRH